MEPLKTFLIWKCLKLSLPASTFLLVHHLTCFSIQRSKKSTFITASYFGWTHWNEPRIIITYITLTLFCLQSGTTEKLVHEVEISFRRALTWNMFAGDACPLSVPITEAPTLPIRTDVTSSEDQSNNQTFLLELQTRWRTRGTLTRTRVFCKISEHFPTQRKWSKIWLINTKSKRFRNNVQWSTCTKQPECVQKSNQQYTPASECIHQLGRKGHS